MHLNINEDELYDEISGFNIFYNKEKFSNDINLIDKWRLFFEISNSHILILIMESVFSIYVSNAYVERIFSIMNNICSDKRNRLLTEAIKGEICSKVNFNLGCNQFYDFALKNKKLLNAAKSNLKYVYKIK